MATVGYGDIHPVTASGKLLAILIIITGVGTFLGVIANTTELMLNRKITADDPPKAQYGGGRLFQ